MRRTYVADEEAAEDGDASVAAWLYYRAAQAVHCIATECSPLEVCLKVLSVVIKVRCEKQHADRSEDINYTMFWNALKTIDMRHSHKFVSELVARMSKMAEDDGLNEGVPRSLRKQ